MSAREDVIVLPMCSVGAPVTEDCVRISQLGRLVQLYCWRGHDGPQLDSGFILEVWCSCPLGSKFEKSADLAQRCAAVGIRAEAIFMRHPEWSRVKFSATRMQLGSCFHYFCIHFSNASPSLIQGVMLPWYACCYTGLAASGHVFQIQLIFQKSTWPLASLQNLTGMSSILDC